VVAAVIGRWTLLVQVNSPSHRWADQKGWPAAYDPPATSAAARRAGPRGAGTPGRPATRPRRPRTRSTPGPDRPHGGDLQDLDEAEGGSQRGAGR